MSIPFAVGSSQLPAVAVVSVTYNRCQQLLVLLHQISRLNYDQANLDIFLVDNASRDDTLARVKAEFPAVHLIESPENTGVAAGFNCSVQEALRAPRAYRYLWLLDSDAEVEPDTLIQMVSAMERHSEIGIAGSAVYDPVQRTRLVTAGLRIDWRRADVPFVLPAPGSRDALIDVDLIPACSMLTRASLYSRIGYWDLRFPLYWGDTDWCARALLHGARVCCVTRSRAWHRDWSSVVRSFGAAGFIRDHVRGALLFHLRHGRERSLAATRRLMLKSCLKAGLERLTLRRSFAHAYLAAVDDLLHGRFPRDVTPGEEYPAPVALEQIAVEAAGWLPPRPSILLNQVEGADRRAMIRATFERHVEGIVWREIHPESASSAWTEYRLFNPGQLLRHAGRLLRGFGRAQLSICDVSRPLLYNFAAGHHTVLVDGANRGVLIHNALFRDFVAGVLTVLRGLKASYVDLPLALKSCESLRKAVRDNRGAV